MRHFKYVIFAFWAFLLTACASGPKIDYDGITTSIASGDKGGVIGGFEGPGLSYSSLVLENTENGSISGATFSRSPRVYDLEPGTYRVKSGRVGGHNVTGNMPLIGLWANDFTVEPGKVMNLGLLRMMTITNNMKTSAGSKVLNALNSFGTNVNNDITHVAYEVLPLPENKALDAVSKFPCLEDRVEDKPLELLFNETEFRDAVETATQLDEDGKLPTKAEIQEKLSKEILFMYLKKKGLPEPDGI